MNELDIPLQMLREQLHSLLDALHPAQRADIIVALQDKGKLLSSSIPSGIWPLLTLLVAEYLDPGIDVSYASKAALSIECVICALDVLDDLEDGDHTTVTRLMGPARALNTSTALLALAQHILGTLPARERTCRLVLQLGQALLAATAGQHLDLLAEHQQSITEADYLEIAGLKAGMLMQLACQFGAICAEADTQMLQLWEEFALCFGIEQQLANDCRDLEIAGGLDHPMRGGKKTDLLRNKKTLPILYATQLLPLTESKLEDSTHALQVGVYMAKGIGSLYRLQAREKLRRIHQIRPLTPALSALLHQIQ